MSPPADTHPIEAAHSKENACYENKKADEPGTTTSPKQCLPACLLPSFLGLPRLHETNEHRQCWHTMQPLPTAIIPHLKVKRGRRRRSLDVRQHPTEASAPNIREQALQPAFQACWPYAVTHPCLRASALLQEARTQVRVPVSSWQAQT